jgi:hypothetical protein
MPLKQAWVSWGLKSPGNGRDTRPSILSGEAAAEPAFRSSVGFSALRLDLNSDLTISDSSDGFSTTRLCGFQAHRSFDNIDAGMIPLFFI